MYLLEKERGERIRKKTINGGDVFSSVRKRRGGEFSKEHIGDRSCETALTSGKEKRITEEEDDQIYSGIGGLLRRRKKRPSFRG